MFTKLTDTRKAVIFSVLVLGMAVGAALLIRMLDLTAGMGMWILWSFTPTVAALLMLLVVTWEGYSREGWKSLGLHRLGLNVWWIAFGGTSLITVAASAVVWATPLASFVMPEDGIVDPVISFLIPAFSNGMSLKSASLRLAPPISRKDLSFEINSASYTNRTTILLCSASKLLSAVIVRALATSSMKPSGSFSSMLLGSTFASSG